MRSILNKLKSIDWAKMAPYGGGIFAVVLLIVLSIVTHNDSIKKDDSEVITRFPNDISYFFDDKIPDSQIILSWQDNTVELQGGNPASLKLDAKLYPITLGKNMLSFSSSDFECAEIDGDGNIIAKKPGSVEITVNDSATNRSIKAYLQVIQHVEGFYIQNSSLNMYMTDTGVRVVPVIYPENASNKAIKWYSKDSNIVEVDQTGHLKPISTGITEVVATTADGGYTAKCFVNIINETVKVSSVTILNKDKTEINKGETIRLLATVMPENARNKHINWTSSDSTVVSVTKTGIIKGVGVGTATITAQSADGAYDTFTVTAIATNNGYVPENSQNQFTLGGVTYVSYDMTLDEMVQKQMATNPVYNDGNGLKSADINRTRTYVDPSEFATGAYKYQFMDLSKYNGVSRDVLAKFLDGKGILSGKADVFIEAAKRYNVSELYLVAHACLETGYGTSQLSTGVNYNGVRVYNMFGIGAFDSDAVGTGSKKAYNEGWTTPDAAIMGGAKWISENYINSPTNRQNTLYKMRWNPDNPANHLYAGDIAWATTQSVIMEQLFAKIGNGSISYEVPVYAGQSAPVIEGVGGMNIRR